jgi:hypothetical protein
MDVRAGEEIPGRYSAHLKSAPAQHDLDSELVGGPRKPAEINRASDLRSRVRQGSDPWAKGQAAQAAIGFTELSNGFAACHDPQALQEICDRVGAGTNPRVRRTVAGPAASAGAGHRSRPRLLVGNLDASRSRLPARSCSTHRRTPLRPSTPRQAKITGPHRRRPCHGDDHRGSHHSTVRPLCLSSRPYTRLRVSGLRSRCRLSDEPRDQRWRRDSLCASTERGTLRTRWSAATNAGPTSAGSWDHSGHRPGWHAFSAASTRRGRRRPVGATQGLRFRLRCATPTAFSSIITSRAMRSSTARVQSRGVHRAAQPASSTHPARARAA